MSSNSFIKRLEQLEKAIHARRDRMIVLAVDGNNENHEAEANLLAGLAVTPQDIMVAVRRFCSVDYSDLPKVSSVTTL
jgi:hypothetical protein